MRSLHLAGALDSRLRKTTALGGVSRGLCIATIALGLACSAVRHRHAAWAASQAMPARRLEQPLLYCL